MKHFLSFILFAIPRPCLFWQAGYTNLLANNRGDEGYRRGLDEAKTLLRRLGPEETVKIITHSMGSAFGKGYVQGLLDYIKEHPESSPVISLVADFDTFQTGSLNANSSMNTMQFTYPGGFFGIADERQENLPLIKYYQSKIQTSHSIASFIDEVKRLPDGTYKYDFSTGEFISNKK